MLAHCKIYPLSDYYKPSQAYFNVPKALLSKEDNKRNKDRQLRLVHLIEHNFKVSYWKCELLKQCMGPENGCLLIVDIVSAWWPREKLEGLGIPLYYMNDPSLIKIESIIHRLGEIVANPSSLLSSCVSINGASEELPLTGIILENISYFHDDADDRESVYHQLIKKLKAIQSKFGCWTLTTSYGLDYYNGFEDSLLKYYNVRESVTKTRVPRSFMNEMNLVIMRNDEWTGSIIQ